MLIDTRFFTVKQAAETLGIEEENVLAAIHSGELSAVNVAKNPKGQRPRWRIAESSLGRFLLSRRNAAAPQPPKPRTTRTTAVDHFG